MLSTCTAPPRHGRRAERRRRQRQKPRGQRQQTPLDDAALRHPRRERAQRQGRTIVPALCARSLPVYPRTPVASSSLACRLDPFISLHSSRFVAETTRGNPSKIEGASVKLEREGVRERRVSVYEEAPGFRLGPR